jgi:hypothetical protein
VDAAIEVYLSDGNAAECADTLKRIVSISEARGDRSNEGGMQIRGRAVLSA